MSGSSSPSEEDSNYRNLFLLLSWALEVLEFLLWTWVFVSIKFLNLNEVFKILNILNSNIMSVPKEVYDKKMSSAYTSTPDQVRFS